MNTIFTKRFDFKKVLMMSALMLSALLLTFDSTAQDKDSKIKIKVTTNENGETKTFEKEYDSREEMENDPEYKEFFGNKGPNFFHLDHGKGRAGFNFNFDDDISWVDSTNTSFQGNSFFFKSDGDDDTNLFFKVDSSDVDGQLKLFFKGDDGDGSSSFNFNFDDSMEELTEHLFQLKKGIDTDVFFFDSYSEEGGHEELVERLRDLSKNHGSFDKHGSRVIIIRKKVIIKDLDDSDKELNKLSNKRSKALVLDDFNYYPNPSDGRFNLRFKVDNETPLSVKIYSLSGREIYGESYDSFRGTFNSEIDVSKHEEGIYLLEITQGDKVMNKKLLIE